MRTDRLLMPPNDSDTFQCSECDSRNVSTQLVSHRFKYGAADEAAEISCVLPVRVCADCGAEWVDEEGEMARHEAVCKHLRVLTPREIRAIRERFGSQAHFAQLTGIGEASLSRWETGASVQSKAMDNYLFLIGMKENDRQLALRNVGATTTVTSGVPRRFRNIEVTSIRRTQQERFRLRPTG